MHNDDKQDDIVCCGLNLYEYNKEQNKYISTYKDKFRDTTDDTY